MSTNNEAGERMTLPKAISDAITTYSNAGLGDLAYQQEARADLERAIADHVGLPCEGCGQSRAGCLCARTLAAQNTELVRQLRELRATKDGAYRERDRLVCALSKLFPSWLGRHPDSDVAWDADWRWIVFVQLPTGQASWHIHDSERPWFDHLAVGGAPWDGHSTDEKYRRLEAIADHVAAAGKMVPVDAPTLVHYVDEEGNPRLPSEQDIANTQLAADMRNALPALLRVARAARRCLDGSEVDGWHTPMREVDVAELREALGELERQA